ncbi:MAG: class I SAM-dependent methyltransferase [Chloroflexi bacterium]|nr:MAG: class I SAM-dependent methyltransferase [Chloroflexota bacterium]
MNHWKDLYNKHTNRYERLVQHEDVAGNLLPALAAVCELPGARVVEFGAGTGRISSQLAPLVGQVWAFDLTPAMVRVARQKRLAGKVVNWQTAVSDSRHMPLPNSCADVAIEGWSFVQIATWHFDNWQAELDRAIREMMRVVKVGGTAVLIETLGTGTLQPNPPEVFVPIYDHFEQNWGFAVTWIRTDYHFPSFETACAIVEPVFGPDMLENLIETDAEVALPECTGIWWREVER